MTSELPRTSGSSGAPTRPVPVVVPRVLGDYRLGERVGEGGMGVVWRARSGDGREVAVKVLREHIAHDEQARARLRREVRTLARVHSPRVAAVIDADVDGPAPYIVTEFVPGRPLDRVVEEHGPLRGDDLLRLGRGLGEALRAIHGAGIVHRDLKPGNVLLVDHDGTLEPVVIDFGIAQVADDVRLTATGLVMGTPGYLSPEVVEGGDVGEATDWWGWAATLAFAASGQPPFGRGPLTVVVDRVVRGRLQLDGVDPALRPLLAAALDPDPARRPSQQQVLTGLERYSRGEDVTTALPTWHDDDPTRLDHGDLTRLQPRSPVTRQTPRRRPAPRPAPQREPVRPRREPARWEQQQWAEQEQWEEQRWPGPHRAEPGGAPYPVSPQHQGDLALPDPVDHGSPDPRIGRSSRVGTLTAMLVGFVGLAAAAPLVAWSLFVVWGVTARTVDRVLTSLVLRRHVAGPRRSDVPLLVVSSPWHLVASLVSTVLALLLPAAAALVVAVGLSRFLTSSGTMSGIPVDHPLALGAGSLAAAWLAWWGLGSTSLRRGSRTLVRGAVPRGAVTLVVVTLCLVGGAAIASYAYLEGAASWWPLGPDFDPRAVIPDRF
ncbi:protein kinase domain-containing protein [Ornithinimicrobium pekingense]|uniref:protein kinase domain-containing protein n=1 Tax=Ornithinimicrobium pekingense TaxID=384677 RepID=UPI0003B55AA4|nr:serine/threonine-protein kinase [Ornithinimicrobium pekingense]